MKLKPIFIAALSLSFILTSCDNPSTTSSSDENTSESTTQVNTTSKVDESTLTLSDPPVFDEDTLQIHYHRDDNDYSEWGLWLWETGGNGARYEFNGIDEFGAICAIPLSTFSEGIDEINFIVYIEDTNWIKDVESDQYFSLSDFTKDENNIYHVYIVSTWEGTYDNPDVLENVFIKNARFSEINRVSIQTVGKFIKAEVYKGETLVGSQDFGARESGSVVLTENGNFEETYKVKVVFENGSTAEAEVDKNYLFKTDEFNNAYYYSGDDLGANYTSTSTTFKVWAPGSKTLKLRVYDNGTPTRIDASNGSDDYEEYTMTLGEKGVYSATLTGDLNGKYYTYVVTNSKYEDREVVDPYAKSAGVNGERGMIIDLDSTDPDGWNEISPLNYKKTELVVYETHVADVTSSETWTGSEENRLTFNGMTEEGTTYTEGNVTVKTGFDHIKELGVNAVQIIPLFDQANDEVNKSFNWGYNPLNYNVVEGSYSSNPYDGAVRVKEFKNLIMKYNQAGISIIMDVVYNHVNSLDQSNFNYLVPGYYFRYDENNKPFNGSGCGNETASEMPMFRKFMIDSTEFWASEYKLGGFRFDLMGVHDIETMNQLVANLETVNPNIVVYGEPWTGGTTGIATTESAVQANMKLFEGYGAFNDKIRDGVRGSVFDATATGWATSLNKTSVGYTDSLNGMIGNIGTYCSDPNKVVNYVSAHDNNTLFDKLQLSVGKNNIDLLANLSTLTNGMIFASQGTSFMLAGEELLRSKVKEDGTLDSNSYASSYKTNEIDYSRLIDYPEVMEQYKEFIAVKTNVGAFQLDSEKLISENIQTLSTYTDNYIDYTITYNNETYRVIVNPRSGEELSVDLSSYTSIVADNLDSLFLSNSSKIMPCQIVIVK